LDIRNATIKHNNASLHIYQFNIKLKKNETN